MNKGKVVGLCFLFLGIGLLIGGIASFEIWRNSIVELSKQQNTTIELSDADKNNIYNNLKASCDFIENEIKDKTLIECSIKNISSVSYPIKKAQLTINNINNEPVDIISIDVNKMFKKNKTYKVSFISDLTTDEIISFGLNYELEDIDEK